MNLDDLLALPMRKQPYPLVTDELSRQSEIKFRSGSEISEREASADSRVRR